MTTNNQQGMTDETIREAIANKMNLFFNRTSAGEFIGSYDAADQIISLISQHSASQEAEIKRLKEENQKRIEWVFSEIPKMVKPKMDEVLERYPEMNRATLAISLVDEIVESLKKRVRGDGT